jgi:hypothetical protein
MNNFLLFLPMLTANCGPQANSWLTLLTVYCGLIDASSFC